MGYLVYDFSKPLLGENLATAFIVLDVVRGRIQTRDIDFSRIDCDAERIMAVWFRTSRDDACREASAASAVDGEWNSSQALQKRRLSRRLASNNHKLLGITKITLSSIVNGYIPEECSGPRHQMTVTHQSH